MSRGGRRLVIDASVARAAGQPAAEDRCAASCRDFLEHTLKICHRVVFTEELRGEWRNHGSRFFRVWYRSMVARKKVVEPDPCTETNLRMRLERCGAARKAVIAMLEDAHLIEAALGSDELVVSRDEEVRGYFRAASSRLPVLARVVWVNPENEGERPLQWLADGAPSQAARKLGARAPR